MAICPSGRIAVGARYGGEDYHYDSGNQIRGYAIIIAGDTHVVSIVAETPLAVWYEFWPVFTAMLDSFTFVP